jgi:HEAT repeat protein
MSDLLWSFDQLSRFTRFEDPEVRYWAADRLAALFPDEASDAIAPLILDDHDATPELVAEHLGRHGDARHVPALLKGFRKGGGLMPGRCLESLARLRFESVAALAETALHQRDMSEGSLGLMVKTLAALGDDGHDARAAETAHEFLLRRPELFAEPSALQGALALMATRDLTELILKWITALHFRGLDQIDACVRVLLDELQLEDCGWCVRTDRSGRVDLERTLKAIESGYDLDVRDAIARAVRAEIAETLGRGDFPAIAACLGQVVAQRASGLPRQDDPLPARLEAMGRAFQSGPVLEIADRLGPALHQWLIGLLLAAVVKVSTYRNHVLELQRAGQDVDRLLELAAAESSSLHEPLPARVVAAAPAGSAARGRVVEWCVRTLEARGPFFPKAHALNILGELGAEALIPEIAGHLADENAYIYHAAERALSRLGDPVIEHAAGVIARGDAHPEALQSLVRIACEMTTEGSLALVLEHSDAIFEALGPEAAAECAGLLGRQETIPLLRRWLDRAPALVGHALLLLGAINNVPIPEEESILKAIDEYWKGAGDGSDGEPPGPWLM